MKITPEDAKKLLSFGEGLRSVDPSVVNRYIEDLRSGRFGDPLSLDRVGRERLRQLLNDIDQAEDQAKVESQMPPRCPGCKRAMYGTISGGWGCPTLSTPQCIKDTEE